MVLGKRIGTPLEADNQPHFNENGAFLRVKIRLHARNPLPLGIEFKQADGTLGLLPIKFENLGLFCFKCGRVGHDKGKCMYGFSLMPGIVNTVKPKRYSVVLKGITPKCREICFPEILEEQMHVEKELNAHAGTATNVPTVSSDMQEKFDADKNQNMEKEQSDYVPFWGDVQKPDAVKGKAILSDADRCSIPGRSSFKN